jgi:hypothetical protein
MKILQLTIALLICFAINPILGQEKISLKNSNLEGVKDGKFFWWKHQAKDGGKAKFLVEQNDVNTGSKKALKAEIKKLGPKPWFVSSSFNQKFKGKAGEEILIEFFAKSLGENPGKVKLVFQSNLKGSFQGKDFNLTNEWQSYSHTFAVKDDNGNNQVKFWYMNSETTYLIDELSISRM